MLGKKFFTVVTAECINHQKHGSGDRKLKKKIAVIVSERGALGKETKVSEDREEPTLKVFLTILLAPFGFNVHLNIT